MANAERAAVHPSVPSAPVCSQEPLSPTLADRFEAPAGLLLRPSALPPACLQIEKDRVGSLRREIAEVEAQLACTERLLAIADPDGCVPGLDADTVPVALCTHWQ